MHFPSGLPSSPWSVDRCSMEALHEGLLQHGSESGSCKVQQMYAMSAFFPSFGPQGYPFLSSAQWPGPSFYRKLLARAGLEKCGVAAGGAVMWL